MKTFKYTITDPQGMHARPAGELVKKANEYKSSITIDKAGKQADAKRIFAIMSLGVKQGEEIEISIEGEDEETASEEINEFFKEKF